MHDESVSRHTLHQLYADMERALALSAPDCTTAGFLRNQICDLAESVCDLAERNPSEAELGSRCREARGSCERATARVRNVCP
jgi:hypothetical protein